MSDEIADILFGADPSDIVVGKEPDWTKIFRTIAIVLGIAIVGNMFGSMLIERYRLNALIQEVRSMSLNGIQCAVNEMQNIGENDMSYIVDSSGFITDEYEEYLNALSSLKEDSEMQNVVSLLRYGDSNGERYTPLSFNLTYLSKDALRDLIDENLTNIFEANNSTEFENGKINNGSILEELIMGSERSEYVSCDVEVDSMSVIDITDVTKCNEEEKAMYRAVYGTESQEASKLDGVGLTDKHYLIVYRVRYIVTWRPYTRTFFYQKASPGSKRNADGFLALPEVTDEYTDLYFITN